MLSEVTSLDARMLCVCSTCRNRNCNWFYSYSCIVLCYYSISNTTQPAAWHHIHTLHHRAPRYMHNLIDTSPNLQTTVSSESLANWLHMISPTVLFKCSRHRVYQAPSKHNSTVPSYLVGPSTSLMSPWLQSFASNYNV